MIQPDDDSASPNNHVAMLHILATQSHQTLLRTAAFLRPYIAAAHDRGEVNAQLDIDGACEWRHPPQSVRAIDGLAQHRQPAVF